MAESTATAHAHPAGPPAQPTAPPQAILCPYCGRTQLGGDHCTLCGGLFEPLSRMATQVAMGPWFIRDKANPFKPGCSYETLKHMIERGKIKPNTVLRGPTTRQFWSIARNIPGVAHLVGFCHHCQVDVSPTNEFCPECSERFFEPKERNELGLAFPTPQSAKKAQKELNRRLRQAAGKEASPAAGPASSSDSSLTGQEVGLLQASMDEAMDYLGSPQNAEATGYGMTLEGLGPMPAEDDTPVVSRPLGEASPSRAAEILGRREAAPVPVVEPTVEAAAVVARTSRRARRPLHPVLRILLFLLAFLGLVALGAAITYPLWREQVALWLSA